MASPGRCVHCLEHFDELTSDHVLPDSWYAETTPPNLEKWQVPACRECNEKTGRIEREFVETVALCLNPDHPACAGLVERIMRAYDRNSGKNDKDAQIRHRKAVKMRSRILKGSNLPTEGNFPGLGPRGEEPPEGRVAVGISHSFFEAITHKIVRGLTYLLDGTYIEPGTEIEFRALREEPKPLDELLDKRGTVHECGPSIRVTRVVTVDGSNASIWRIELWGQIQLYAFVGLPMPEDD